MLKISINYHWGTTSLCQGERLHTVRKKWKEHKASAWPIYKDLIINSNNCNIHFSSTRLSMSTAREEWKKKKKIGMAIISKIQKTKTYFVEIHSNTCRRTLQLHKLFIEEGVYYSVELFVKILIIWSYAISNNSSTTYNNQLLPLTTCWQSLLNPFKVRGEDHIMYTDI